MNSSEFTFTHVAVQVFFFSRCVFLSIRTANMSLLLDFIFIRLELNFIGVLLVFR